MLQMPARRTRMRAQPGRSLGNGLRTAAIAWSRTVNASIRVVRSSHDSGNFCARAVSISYSCVRCYMRGA